MLLTVMTYNVRSGTFNPLGLEGIARVIERHRPDVVGLQEINVDRYATGPYDQPRWLGDRLGMVSAFGASVQSYEKNVPSRRGYYGNALLSRFPIRAYDVCRLPRPSQELEQRTVLGVSLETPDGAAVNVFVTHWGLDPAERRLQADATIAYVEAWRPGPPVVLLGDFNAPPDAPEIATVRRLLDDAWEAAAVPLDRRITFPSGPPGSTTPDGWSGAIDYVFVSRGVGIDRIEVAHDVGRASDHQPVVGRFRIDEARSRATATRP